MLSYKLSWLQDLGYKNVCFSFVTCITVSLTSFIQAASNMQVQNIHFGATEGKKSRNVYSHQSGVYSHAAGRLSC